eukprot:CAMPEP_0176057844 /NCGR_PEP_ID=MMETSP0120_2-20121206/28813_1 /TAXON_ID=160619 /ORGANISM="Kryptoperidinium foliaceum, Strain CCMP 1326" /LENGTH=74 /DNA_ID=CAMNT_0017391359 /DNA_START=8 /DNA_END=230 /DNA_ORIENTATION=-
MTRALGDGQQRDEVVGLLALGATQASASAASPAASADRRARQHKAVPIARAIPSMKMGFKTGGWRIAPRGNSFE